MRALIQSDQSTTYLFYPAQLPENTSNPCHTMDKQHPTEMSERERDKAYRAIWAHPPRTYGNDKGEPCCYRVSSCFTAPGTGVFSCAPCIRDGSPCTYNLNHAAFGKTSNTDLIDVAHKDISNADYITNQGWSASPSSTPSQATFDIVTDLANEDNFEHIKRDNKSCRRHEDADNRREDRRDKREENR